MKPSQPIPPPRARQFLQWFLRDDLAEEVLGDLEEKFYAVLAEKSSFRAKLNYWYQVLHYLRPFAVRKPRLHPFIYLPMYRHNFLISWRHLTKNKGYSLLNIGGLAMGMAVAMLIGLWIHDELTFNRYHKNYDRIAKVMRNGTGNGETFTFPFLPYALGNELETGYGSDFKHVLMALPIQEYTLSAGEHTFSRKGEFIEAGAPEMLSLVMKAGTWEGLRDPHSILLSESLSRALFGDAEPMGQRVKINEALDLQVSGIYEDLPRNSEFHEVQFFAPWDLFVSTNAWVREQGFEVNFLVMYVEIQPDTDFALASAHIKDAILDNITTNPEYVAANPQLFLHPMPQWHLYSKWENGVNTGGSIQFVWLFGIIGGFVLLLACINFMNLGTARSEKRAKEVGIRKSLGSKRSQLIGQFLSESLLVASLAFLLSLLLVQLGLPWFNEVVGKEMRLLGSNPWFWLLCLGFTLFTALLAGSYPAFYLSSFLPAKIMKGSFQAGRFAGMSRKVLVVSQFTFSIALIIGTIIVYQQIQHAKNRPVGYSRGGLLALQVKSPALDEKYEILRNELLQAGLIAGMARSASRITAIDASDGGFDWKGKDPAFQSDFGILDVSSEYGKTIGWQVIAGRDFSGDVTSDSSGIVVNEAALKIMGLENAVGENVSWKPVWHKGGNFKILGVVKDMVMQSPFEPAQPTIFFLGARYMNWVVIKIHPAASVSEALAKLEAIYTKLIPSSPIEYTFVEEEYEAKFRAEERTGKVATFFATLAILISCLGLFGLAAFVAEKRTKEIGIRKVLGASVVDLWRLLSKDFVILVLIACLIAIPIAWYFLHGWLQNYTYRTEISGWVFVVAGLGALGITLLTVSFQAIKAAMANPVDSLRSE